MSLEMDLVVMHDNWKDGETMQVMCDACRARGTTNGMFKGSAFDLSTISNF
jgi:hypothetical protein